MYKIINHPYNENVYVIKRLKDNTFIPPAPGNRDYEEYLKWVAEGNTPEPADE